MQQGQRKRNKTSKPQMSTKARRKQQMEQRKRNIERAIYYSVGGIVLFTVLFFVRGFMRPSPGLDVAMSGDSLVQYDDLGQALYTPVPTPDPTPTPTPSPTPIPTPTPYPYKTTGRVIDPDKKMVAITFDDGPSKKVTPQILKILAEHDARATFFMLGENAMENPSIVQEVAAGGHQIASHSFSHPNLNKLSDEEVVQQINDTGRVIQAACGIWPSVIRPPYGSADDRVKSIINVPLINWSVDTLDWKSRNATKVFNNIMKDSLDGSIILMHDLYASTAEATKKAVPALIKSGYQLVTIDELFMYRGPDLAPHKLFLRAQEKVK